MAGLPKNTFKPYIPSGNLRWPMALQSPVEIKTPTGAHTTGWITVVDEIWLELIPLHGGQMFYAQSFAPEATCLMRCRYRTDVQAGMRFVKDMSAFEIMRPPINIEGNNAVLLMYCRELRILTPIEI